MSRKFIYFALIFGIVYGGYKAWSPRITPEPISINAISSTNFPITSTFITPDLGTGKTTDYKNMFSEMKAIGIDTIILPVGAVDKNCNSNPPSFQDYNYLTKVDSEESIALAEALSANLRVFIGLRRSTWFPCMDATHGDPNDSNTDMGHLISHSISIADALKSFLSNKGISLEDPRIAGFYIPEEIETYYLSDDYSSNLIFFKELSARLLPYGKPIILSPWQSDRTTYKLSLQAFKNIINQTNISIIAPQDSMGTGMTTNISINTDHFRALYDAKMAYPSKNIEVWANIEVFQKASNDKTYQADIPEKPIQFIPAPFSRVEQQIESAKPYVSKMTSWIYQHNMMVLPISKDLYSSVGWNTMYTPGMHARRTKLYSDYTTRYSAPASPSQTPSSCTKLYYYNKNTKLCAATSGTYNSSQLNCDNSGNSCAKNLNTYLSGITTGICYTSQSICQSSNSTSTTNTCTKLYYYNKVTKLCTATSDTYNSSQLNCDNSGNSCAKNLNLYLKGKTSGVCYTSLTNCKKAN